MNFIYKIVKSHVNVIVISITYISLLLGEGNILSGNWKGYNTKYVKGEIIIGLAEGISKANVTDLFEENGINLIREFGLLSIGLVDVCCEQDIFELIPTINNSPLIRFAEPNIVGSAEIHPNDPYYLGNLPAPDNYPHQWGLHNTGQHPPGGTVDADIDVSPHLSSPESYLQI